MSQIAAPSGARPSAQQFTPLTVIDQNPKLLPDASRPPIKGVICDRPAFAYVDVYLDDHEQVLADGRAMIWMDSHVRVETKSGSCSTACARSCAGESFCQNIFHGPGKVTFSFKLPGDMLPFAVTPGQGWILNSGSFVCGTTNLNVSSQFTGCFACTCGGEGLFFTRVRVEEDGGFGMFYAGGYGALVRHEVEEGQQLLVDSGLFFAANEGTKFELALPGGCKGCLFGREGFFLKIQGPSVVITQNRDPSIWKKVLKPKPQKKQQQSNGGGGGGGN